MIVSNSSPIIFLGKQGNMELMKKCFKKVIISNGVYDEVSGKGESLEFVSLKKAISSKWVNVEKAKTMPLLVSQRIGRGEQESISLAIRHKSMLIIDDDTARRLASIIGVEAHGTLYVIFLAYRKGFIGKEKAIRILKQTMSEGFYISSEVYHKFISSL